MELVGLKNDEQFFKNFKDEDDPTDTWRAAVKYPNLQELARINSRSFWKALACAKQDFQE